MKKVLITGSEGFVGKHLVKYLKNINQLEIVGLDLRASLNEKNYQIDLLDPKQTSFVLKTEKPDYIIHLAGINKADSYEDFYRLNLFTTINLLNGIIENKLNQVKTLFLSSSAVYGQAKEIQVTENSTVNPINFYGSSKLAMEIIVRQYEKNHNLLIYIARPFNLFGPGQENSFVIPAFIHKLLKIKYGLAEPVLNIKNLTSSRDFLDVRDAVEAYWKILNHGSSGEIYNIASGRAVEIKSILNTIMELIDIKSSVTINQEENHLGEIQILAGNTYKLQHLGWSNMRTLKESLYDQIKSIEMLYEKNKLSNDYSTS